MLFAWAGLVTEDDSADKDSDKDVDDISLILLLLLLPLVWLGPVIIADISECVEFNNESLELE
jgi:hypothetical protein